MQLEIEQKFRDFDPLALNAQIAALGVSWSAPLRQLDTYLQHPARDFRQTDEAFRVRQIGEQNFLTYKGPKLDRTTKTRRELELPVATGTAAAAQFIELFIALGFSVAGTVAKSRHSAAITQSGFQIEIARDEVDGLGTFVELEILASPEQLDSARDALQMLAKQLKLNTIERRSYLELLALQNTNH